MECIRENYPRDVFYNLMNVVGTHDTARALTLLGVTENEWKMDRNGRAHYQLPPDRLEIALRRLRMAAVIQFTMPGSPTIYYGDEAGQQASRTRSTAGPTRGDTKTRSCLRSTASCAKSVPRNRRLRTVTCSSATRQPVHCCDTSARAETRVW